jgi:hypothetical protein
MPVLAADENTPAGDRGLSKHRDDAGNSKRPSQFELTELGHANSGLRLEAPVLDVCSPAVE